jgi:hypothetical protein
MAVIENPRDERDPRPKRTRQTFIDSYVQDDDLDLPIKAPKRTPRKTVSTPKSTPKRSSKNSLKSTPKRSSKNSLKSTPKSTPKRPRKKREKSVEPEYHDWRDDEPDNDGKQESEKEIPIPFEDNPSVAFLVMFQKRFFYLFEGCPSLGPQDIEYGLSSSNLSLPVEQFMCRLLTIVLNRKKPVEPGKYFRALEELQSHVRGFGTWPYWPQHIRLKTSDPLNSLSKEDRLGFLHMLVLWTLGSENIRNSVNPGEREFPLGMDGSNYRYWLVQGQGATRFRIFRQTNPRLKRVEWVCVASSLPQVGELIHTTLADDHSLSAGQLRGVLVEVEQQLYETEELREVEEKKEERRRRKQTILENRQAEIATKSYEGRTRGKRINYALDNYADMQDSEGDNYYSPATDDEHKRDDRATRRSARLRGTEASVERLVEEPRSHGEYTSDGLEAIPEVMVSLKLPPQAVAKLKASTTVNGWNQGTIGDETVMPTQEPLATTSQSQNYREIVFPAKVERPSPQSWVQYTPGFANIQMAASNPGATSNRNIIWPAQYAGSPPMTQNLGVDSSFGPSHNTALATQNSGPPPMTQNLGIASSFEPNHNIALATQNSDRAAIPYSDTPSFPGGSRPDPPGSLGITGTIGSDQNSIQNAAMAPKIEPAQDAGLAHMPPIAKVPSSTGGPTTFPSKLENRHEIRFPSVSGGLVDAMKVEPPAISQDGVRHPVESSAGVRDEPSVDVPRRKLSLEIRSILNDPPPLPTTNHEPPSTMPLPPLINLARRTEPSESVVLPPISIGPDVPGQNGPPQVTRGPQMTGEGGWPNQAAGPVKAADQMNENET